MIITPYSDVQLDKYIRVTGTQNKANLTTRPAAPQTLKLAAGILTWVEPSDLSNITHYIVRKGYSVSFAKVPVGQTRVDGVDSTFVSVASFNEDSGLESIEVYANGTVGDPGFPSGAWTAYTPTTTNLAGTILAAAGIKIGKTAFARIQVTGTSNGANPALGLPYPPANNSQILAGVIIQAGIAVSGVALVVGSTVLMSLYNNAALGAATVYTFRAEGPYEIA